MPRSARIPVAIRERLGQHLAEECDRIGWMRLANPDRTSRYADWTSDPNIGGTLSNYMPLGRVKTYIKDTLIKEYSRAKRREARARVMQILGVQGGLEDITCEFQKPPGACLSSGWVFTWSAARDWKTSLLCTFERLHETQDTASAGIVLFDANGPFAEETFRGLVRDAAERLDVGPVFFEEL
jgi:hypothetical protein